MAETKTAPKRYRLCVYVKGATPQHFYAGSTKGLDAKRRAAIKALTMFEPGGGGNLHPSHVDIQEASKGAGRDTHWVTVETIQYKDVPKEQYEWARRAELQREVREAEAALEKTKPPLGLMPRWRWRELRMVEIQAAMERYTDAGMEIPDEWFSEHRDHVASTPMRHICQSCSQPLVLCPHFNEMSEHNQAWAREVSEAESK